MKGRQRQERANQTQLPLPLIFDDKALKCSLVVTPPAALGPYPFQANPIRRKAYHQAEYFLLVAIAIDV